MLRKTLAALLIPLLLSSAPKAAQSYPEVWGYHLILDIKGCDIPSATNPGHIDAFVKELVQEIQMKAYGDPMIVHFGTNDLSGYTLLQLIETSSITAHFMDHNGDAYIDVFSCKYFKPETAIAVIEKYFQPQHIRKRFLKRQA